MLIRSKSTFITTKSVAEALVRLGHAADTVKAIAKLDLGMRVLRDKTDACLQMKQLVQQELQKQTAIMSKLLVDRSTCRAWPAGNHDYVERLTTDAESRNFDLNGLAQSECRPPPEHEAIQSLQHTV